ncbi:8136_t:CDS:2 [Paraglomus brasilianum]|uniref:8136_t:CDS:1 n=1 Tax=Paraglomus brasilianum TaxID=144538 RepID=A0A9N8ZQ55_9GLOM|nr:8136_t:CDS:2 [Paraglomus brasilianum]
MRLPSVIRLPSFGHSKKKSNGERTRKVDASSSMTASSSSTRKVPPDTTSETSPDSDDTVDPQDFFENETWKKKSLRLEFSDTSSLEPKNWLSDIEISSDSRIEGVSAYESPSPTFRPLHSTVFDRLERLERAATVHVPPTTLSSSKSFESFSPEAEPVIRIKSRYGLGRYNSIDSPHYDTQSEGEMNETDLERKRRRRRTYHIVNLNANPFFHAAGKGAKMRELYLMQQELEESENHNKA